MIKEPFHERERSPWPLGVTGRSCLSRLGTWLACAGSASSGSGREAQAALGLHVLCFPVHRMNNGPVLGHEEEVGRRTTFRLFYPESVFSDPKHNDPNTTAILTAFKTQDLKWLWELLTGSKVVSWQNPSPSPSSSFFPRNKGQPQRFSPCFCFISEH